MKKIPIFVILALLIGTIVVVRTEKISKQLQKNQPESETDLRGSQEGSVPSSQTEVIASNLEIPWELVFLPASPGESLGGPDGQMLLTERAGRVLLINETKKDFQIKEVAHIGEGGLLGATLDPDFSKNAFLYLYFTYREKGNVLNKIQRFIFKKESLNADRVILENIPGSNNHDGGRIKFGPDGKLYITTGDAQNPDSAQDLGSLAGKILRLNSDGSIPADNPIGGSLIYSYGHRNPQGLTWDENGQLWATEHGHSTQDEVNLIRAGSNYGWPVIRGNQTKEGMEPPVINSGADTWAPSGAVIKDEIMYFAGLRGQAVYAFDLETKKLKSYFKGQYGRIRSINLGPDGNFYLITSNRDGRNNSPDQTDDRLIRIVSDLLR